NSLDKLGWGVRDLGPVELPNGIAFGSYAFRPRSGPSANGASGNVLLAAIEIRADEPGPLEIRLTGTHVVDASGTYLDATGGEQTVTVYIAGRGKKHAAPAKGVPSPKAGSEKKKPGNATGDNVINGADATQAALDWNIARSYR